MKRVLIVGIDTILGSNLARTMSHRHQVLGLSQAKTVGIAGCENLGSMPQTSEDIHRQLAATAPDLVVVCGAAARSIWSAGDGKNTNETDFDAPVFWAKEVAKTNAKLIVISSDAVFHGPWMFHEEDCTGVCHSSAATAIREMETQVSRLCPHALIVRTHAFGWSPLAAGDWLEALLEKIAEETPLAVPAVNYATPIEASRLAEILIQAWDRGLEGIYHIGGSERVNFVHFAHRLAQEFQLPRPSFPRRQPAETAHVFGQGETSLNSGKVRRTLASPLPMLGESLKQLRELSENGSRGQLQEDSRELLPHAA